MKSQRLASMVAGSLLLIGVIHAQDAVPGEILARTLEVRNNVAKVTGTAFLVEHKGTAYLVTARHVVEGLPTTKATLDVWKGGNWNPIQTVKTLFPKSNDVDIAVLKLDEKLKAPYEITSAGSSGGVTMGQQVWFLGYPYEIGTKFGAGSVWKEMAPFIKRGTMSAIDGSNPDAVVLYVDGFNNPGFSGGPIVFWDFSSHKYQILGVVKGYRPESAKIEVNGKPVDTNLMVNSGILIAYSIKHADDAIAADDTP